MARNATRYPERNALLRNGAAILVSRSLWAISVLVTVPVILSHLGTDGFGVWESLVAIGAMAAVFQTVLGGTVLWRISTLHGEENIVEMRRLAGIGISLTLFMSVLLGLLAWPLRDSFCDAMRVPLEYRGAVRWLMPCSVVLNLLGGINQILLAILAGRQAAGSSAMIQNAGLILANAVTVVIILSGAGISALAWGLAATLLTTLVMATWAARRICPGLCLWPTLPTKVDVVTVGPFAGLLLLSSLTVLLRDQLDKLLLSAAESSASTAHFGIAQRMTSLVMQICIVLHVPLTAGVAASYARGEWHRVVTLYATTARWMGCLCGWLTLMICTLRTPLFVLWLGHDIPDAHHYLWPLLFGTGSAIILAGAGVALAKGVGMPGLETSYTMVTLVLTLITKPLCIWWFGTWGAVLSSAISWSFGAWCLLFLLHRALDLPRRLAWQTQGTLLVAMLMSFLGWWVGSYIPAPLDRPSSIWLLARSAVPITLLFASVLGGLHFLPEILKSFLGPMRRSVVVPVAGRGRP